MPVVGFLAISLGSSSAGALVIDIESLGTGFNAVASPYTEDGFSIEDATKSPTDLKSIGSGSSFFAGSTAMALTAQNETVRLTRSDAARFSLLSIDLSEFTPSSPTTLPVVFTGQVFGGGSASVTLTLDQSFGFQTFSFSSAFSDLTSVSFRNGAINSPQNYQFDDIVALWVPEPSTALLLVGGLAGLALGKRTRA